MGEILQQTSGCEGEVPVSAGAFQRAGQYLIASTSRPKHGEPLAPELMRELKRLRDIPGRGGSWKIDGFGDAAVAIPLEGGLHPHMM